MSTSKKREIVMKSLGKKIQELRNIIKASGGKVYAFPFRDSNVGYQYPYNKEWHDPKEDYFEINLADQNVNTILQHLSIILISKNNGFIFTKPDNSLFDGPKKVFGGNNYLKIKEIICAFNREGFLDKNEIYSEIDNEFYQILIEGISPLSYKFDSEEWKDNWGFDLAFTGHRGGQDFDWYKK
ncbi:MAG: hypothetical protein EU543_04495 [Promethearchaeota archaeon]|nr:MAG: hypothetical protein EU543_04495 [Candidatus Lokiarchaeota archaeon]